MPSMLVLAQQNKAAFMSSSRTPDSDSLLLPALNVIFWFSHLNAAVVETVPKTLHNIPLLHPKLGYTGGMHKEHQAGTTDLSGPSLLDNKKTIRA